MSSLLRSVKKRKKSRVLGEVDVLSREEYSGLELDSKVEMIRALIPLGLMHVEELLDEEVKALAGERYARKEAALRAGDTGAIRGPWGWGASGCRFGCLECAAWRAGRFRFGATRNSVRMAR